MSPIGPGLPPHLAKERGQDADRAKSSDSDSDSPGPRPPFQRPHYPKKETEISIIQKQRAVAGPTLPPSEDILHESTKRKRVAGPTLPPAPLDQKPSLPADDTDSDSSDDYGPSLPTAGTATSSAPVETEETETSRHKEWREDEDPKRPSRAEWMTLPPSASSSLNFDPSRHRARGFKTKPTAVGGKASGDGPAAQWTETPEEKRKRLANEVLGITSTSSTKVSSSLEQKRKLKAEENAATASRISSKRRGEDSLMEAHAKKHRKDDEEDNDPSKRNFDWEKDMNSGMGMTVSGRQRKEMVSKAATEFGGRFSGGGFL